MLAMGNYPTNLGPIRTKEAELSEVDGMVCCHIEAFPERFMTEMGPRWLRGLYSYFIQHDGGICLVAVDRTGKVLGFAVGGDPTIRDGFLRKAIFRYPHILFWKFLTVSIVRRKLLAELFKKFHIGRRTSSSDVLEPQKADEVQSGGLVSIAVLSQFQGTSIAGELIKSFQATSVEKGYDIMRLSVYTNNLRAIAFYKKHGWYEIGREQSSTHLQLDLTGK